MDNINEKGIEAANSNGASKHHLKMMEKVNINHYEADNLIMKTYDAFDVLDEIIEDQRNEIIAETENGFCMECISEVSVLGAKIRIVHDLLVDISNELEESKIGEIETKDIEV